MRPHETREFCEIRETSFNNINYNNIYIHSENNLLDYIRKVLELIYSFGVMSFYANKSINFASTLLPLLTFLEINQ